MKGYKTSKDYHRLKELLDNGYEVICIADYDWHDGHVSRDVCRARRDDDYYRISSRGIEYTAYWPGMRMHKSFEHACERSHIEFIEPEEE